MVFQLDVYRYLNAETICSPLLFVRLLRILDDIQNYIYRLFSFPIPELVQ